jgi:hypothetical protein
LHNTRESVFIYTRERSNIRHFCNITAIKEVENREGSFIISKERLISALNKLIKEGIRVNLVSTGTRRILFIKDFSNISNVYIYSISYIVENPLNIYI